MAEITAQQAQELLDKATPGPWMHDPEGFMGCGQVYTMGEHVMGGSIAGPTGDLYPRSGYSPKDDMLLITHARDLAETVVALTERLEIAEAKVRLAELTVPALFGGD